MLSTPEIQLAPRMLGGSVGEQRQPSALAVVG
jgi:hypothetical protein